MLPSSTKLQKLFNSKRRTNRQFCWPESVTTVVQSCKFKKPSCPFPITNGFSALRWVLILAPVTYKDDFGSMSFQLFPKHNAMYGKCKCEQWV